MQERYAFLLRNLPNYTFYGRGHTLYRGNNGIIYKVAAIHPMFTQTALQHSSLASQNPHITQLSRYKLYISVQQIIKQLNRRHLLAQVNIWCGTTGLKLVVRDRFRLAMHPNDILDNIYFVYI